jgi:hypothetical protein
VLLGLTTKDGHCYCYACGWTYKCRPGEATPEEMKRHLYGIHDRFLVSEQPRRLGGTTYHGPEYRWSSIRMGER